jgi:hypothetical protein
MCELSDEGLANWDDLEKHKDQGWVPLILVMGQLRMVDGEPQFDANHLHYSWSVSTEMVMFLATSLIHQIMQQEMEDQIRDQRKN